MRGQEPDQSRIARELLRPAPPRVTRAVGAACLSVAITLAVLLCWALNKASGMATQSAGLWVFLIVVAALFAFFLLAAYRLLRNQGNKYGSLLSPALWAILSVVFLLLALVGVALCIGTRDYSQFDGVLYALLFSLLSYGAASYFKSKVKR